MLCRTSKQRSEEYHKAKKKGVETELLHVYNLSTQALQMSSISTSFGEANLYTEITNGINSQHVEEMLSRLENEAAQVITAIQEACGQGAFVLTQRSLDVLHKFVYIMHYRKPNIRAKYFNVDPDDPLSDWIQRYMRTHQIETPEGLWLHGLAYILETSHPQIVLKGEQIYSQYGARLVEMVSSKVDPNLENWFAVDYRALMNSHYFGVWEAAPGCEFIMGNNCFGLWEGLVLGKPDIHRIFITSPKLALILRINSFREYSEEQLRPFIKSALAGIHMPSPTIRVHSGPPNVHFQRAGRRPVAQEGAFTYKITKLTAAQTREVNEVILLNVKSDGVLVFASKQHMLKAIRYHITSPDRIVHSQKPYERFSALLHTLERASNPLENPTRIIESDADFRLRVVLEVLRRGLGRFRSEWDLCHWCYRAMTADSNQTHPLAINTRLRLWQTKTVINASIEGKFSGGKPPARVIDSLSKEESDQVLGLVSALLKTLMKYDETEPGTDRAFVRDSTIVGLVEWMAKEQQDFLVDLVGSDIYKRLTRG